MQARRLQSLLFTCVFLCLSLLNAQEQGGDGPDLPDFIAPCYRDDPMLSECVRSTMYGVIRKVVYGIPELDVPPIEPLHKDEIDAFNVGGLGLKFKNILIHGVSGLKFFENSASTKTKVYTFHGDIDPLVIDADYELAGFFFFVPLRATGTIHVLARHLDFKVDAIVDAVNRNGVNFVDVHNFTMKAYITDGSSWISNLGPFEAAINQVLNNRVNARWIMNHLAPIIEETVAYILEKFLNRIFKSVPYDMVLLKGTGPVPASTVAPDNTNDMFINDRNVTLFKKIMSSLYK